MKRFRLVQLGALAAFVAAIVLMAGCGSDDEDGPVAAADLTAPATPLGVTAAAGAASDKPGHRYVDVAWEANSEADLAGYNVYWTATPDEEASYEYLGFVPSGTESYQDEKAESYGYVYYKISAMDDSQNESDRSEPAATVVAQLTGGSKVNPEDPYVGPGD